MHKVIQHPVNNAGKGPGAHSALICKGTEEPSDRQFRLKRRMSEYPDKKREVDTVSNRELAKELIDGFTDAQLYTVIGMLYAEKKRLEEAEDDAFCLKLAQEYEHLPEEEKGDFLPLEDAVREAGLTMDEIRNLH